MKCGSEHDFNGERPMNRYLLKSLLPREAREELEHLDLEVQLEKWRADYARAAADKAEAELRMALADREIGRLMKKLQEGGE